MWFKFCGKQAHEFFSISFLTFHLLKQESAKHFSSKRKGSTTSNNTESPSPAGKKAKTALTVEDDSEDSGEEIATTPSSAKSLKKTVTKATMAKAMTPIDLEPGSLSGTTDDEETTNEKIQGKNILKNDPFGLIRATYKAEARSAQIKAGSNKKVSSTTSRSKPAVPAKATFPSIFAMTSIDTADVKGLASMSEKKNSVFANEATGTIQEPENEVFFPDSPIATPLTSGQKDETNEATNGTFEKMKGNVPEELQSASRRGEENDAGFHVLDNVETFKQQEGKVHSVIEGCDDKDEDTKMGEAEHENMQNSSEFTTLAKPHEDEEKLKFLQTVQGSSHPGNGTLVQIGRHAGDAVSNMTQLDLPDPALFPDQFRPSLAVFTITFNVRVAGALENEATRMISVPSNVSFRVFFGNVSLELEAAARVRLALANDCKVQYPGFAALAFGFRKEDAEMGWRMLMMSITRIIRGGQHEHELVQMQFY